MGRENLGKKDSSTDNGSNINNIKNYFNKRIKQSFRPKLSTQDRHLKNY